MQRISFSPSSPAAGDTIEVCYDFDGLPYDSVTIQIGWAPSGCGVSSVVLKRDDPCADVASCEAAIVADLKDEPPASPTLTVTFS